MENSAIEKSKVITVVDILEYIPNSVAIKTIIKKITGTITTMAFGQGEVLTRDALPFDNFILVIDGNAEIVIDEKSNLLETGQSIIVPAHCRTIMKANVKFKLLSTIIKNGYEEIS